MTTFTARTAEDVLALVPVLIGFEPQESIVMLTFGSQRSFHARVDLPPLEGIGPCTDSLLAPVRRHGVRRVMFVLFSGRERPSVAIARRLRRAFRAAGVDVIDVIRAHEGRWFALVAGSGVPAHGVPYDAAGHPFRAQAVVDGRVVAGSRQELVDRLRPVAAAVAGVEDALVDLWSSLPHAGEAGEDARSTDEIGAAIASLRPTGPQLRAMLDRHLVAGTVPGDEEAARILLAVHDTATREHAWFGMRRAEAVQHVRLWTDLVRRAPERLVAGAAGVLAFAAWMEGDGAFAWCAVDRCLADQPDHSLGRIVADALHNAAPPRDDWDGMFPGGVAG